MSAEWKEYSLHRKRILPSSGEIQAVFILTHFIVECQKKGIQKEKMYGVETIAGNGKSEYKDGIGKEAEFNRLTGIVISNQRNVLYIAERGNRCIRKISLVDGTTTTITGGPGTVNTFYSLDIWNYINETQEE